MRTLCIQWRNDRAEWKRHSLDFKRRAVERMRACDEVQALAGELKLPRGLLYTGKRQLEGRPEARRADLIKPNAGIDRGADAAGGKPAAERSLGAEGTGSGFFCRCLAQSRGTTPEEHRFWRDSIYVEIGTWGEQAQGKLTLERMCDLVPLSRAGYYRHWAEKAPAEEEMTVRAAIEAFAPYFKASELGTRMYLAWQQNDDPTRFVHFFIFEDEAANKAHSQSEAVKRFEAAYRPELDGGNVVFTDYNLIATNRE